MNTKQDIRNLADIILMVDTFYSEVRRDALIGPVFESRIRDQWPRHLGIMYSFWQTVLLSEHTYQGSPFLKHATLPIGKEHFDRWLMLFTQCVDGLFSGEKAEEAKLRAARMATMFQIKLDHLKTHPGTPLK